MQLLRLSIFNFLIVVFFAVGSKAQIVRGWIKLEADMNMKETQVREQRDLMKGLINQKKTTKSSVVKKNVIEQLIEAQRTLRGHVEKYNELRMKAIYKYPEKGDLTERRYLPMRVQSIEQIEAEVGLDSELTRVKSVIDKKYKKYNKKDESVYVEQAEAELNRKKKRRLKGYRKQEKIKMLK